MYEELLRRQHIRREKFGPAEVKAALARSARDLTTAEALLGQDDDWALAVAHNAALQAGRALMFAEGFRPGSTAGHKAVFSFLRECLGDEHATLVSFVDRIRVKRHTAVYDAAGAVTSTEARQALDVLPTPCATRSSRCCPRPASSRLSAIPLR